ncbi:MAG: beta-galactosidase [Candidatus Hydrogenedentota bacterium]
MIRVSIALMLAALPSATGQSDEFPPTSPSLRLTMDLNGVWKFYPAFKEVEVSHEFLQEGLAHAPSYDDTAEDRHFGWMEPDFDDAAWWDIPVPASWNAHFDDLWSYEGQAWYRKRIAIPAEWQSKAVAFQSDGSNYRTVLYVNGAKAGVHEGGYTQFTIPIHEYLRYGEDNGIAVAVDNESKLERVPMERHDWWNHGGLYRPVRLLATNPERFDDVIVTTDALSAPPSITVQATVSASFKGYAVARVLDAGGAEVASQRFDASSNSTAEAALSIPDARLWYPESPYLYTLHLGLVDADSNACVDTWQSAVGIRTISIDGVKLLLNGKPYLIKGVNRYENYPDTGMTTTGQSLEQDIALIKGLGANAVRCHYPYANATYDALDRAGMLAVCEVPLYQWGRIGHSEKNLEAAKAQLTEMVRTLRNHPSVMMWSVSNENRIHPREKGEEYARISEMVAAGNLALVELAHQLDPSRPIIEPSNEWPRDIVLEETDLNSVNVYMGISAPHVKNLPELPGGIREKLATLRETHPGKPLLVTEFGSWALYGLKTHYFPGEIYQAELLRTEWETFMKEPDFVGGFVWCFADSDVHRHYSRIYEMRCAYGLFDLHRRPKEAASVMRGLWTKSNDN